MTVKQSHAGIVSYEVHFGFLVTSKHHDVFEDTCRGFPGQAGQLEAVPVQMNRMYVVTRIAQAKTIAFALFQVKGGRYRFVSHGKRNAIDGPAVESFFRRVVFRKSHVDSFVGLRSCGAGFGEPRVTPFERGGREPLRLSSAARVLDHNSHAMSAVAIVEITQNPDAGMVHVHERRDALSSANPQNGNVRWIRN